MACKAMLTCLGWNNAESSSMYNNQVIKSIGEFRSLDDESVKTICKVLRRPGSFMATGAPDPCIRVNTRSESNLLIAV